MTAEVTTEIAAFINAHPYDKHMSADVVGDLVSDDKKLRTSDAYTKVSRVTDKRLWSEVRKRRGFCPTAKSLNRITRDVLVRHNERSHFLVSNRWWTCKSWCLYQAH